MNKRRILIVGGGCGGIATAWALTKTPELRARFDVTLVQPGWRLGGKGATGRDPQRSNAVLEHGLHMWLGWYETAFGMIHDLYQAWDGPKTGPQSSLEAAFTPQYTVAMRGGPERSPETWHFRLPETAGRPWEKAPPMAWARLASTWARRLVSDVVDDGPGPWTPPKKRVLAELAAVVTRGLAVEIARHGSQAFDHMDREDLRAWLRRHGASDAAANSPPIGGLYDLGFAYPDGRPGPARGSAAAGVALRVLLHMFGSYRGAPFYRMNAGMGDTIFAPAHDVLRDRGVHFRFFTRLDELHTDGHTIHSLTLSVQATHQDRYEPLIDVHDVRAWPNAPLTDQLDELAPGDLEADSGPSLRTELLRSGEHYDDVVLAVPSSAHRHFATQLMATNDAYRAMVQHTTGVATVAAQWWMARTPAQLGWPGATPVVTGLPGLFRTWADMSEIVHAEGWSEPPASLAYLCNVAPPELQGVSDRAAAGRWVAQRMADWAHGALKDVWPNAWTAGERFDQGALNGGWQPQYARANVADWERYILSLPGTTAYRLHPGGSGFDNLYLAGDWTRNRVNGGSVEGATHSGVTAAAAIIHRSDVSL